VGMIRDGVDFFSKSIMISIASSKVVVRVL